MRVAFNARLLYSPSLRGWNRYTLNLLAELPALGVTPILYGNRPFHGPHLERLPEGSFEVKIAPPMRYLRWEQSWLPRRCALDRAEVLHSPMNFGLPWSSPCPRVLTLHDAIDQIYSAPKTSLRDRLRPTSIYMVLMMKAARSRAHRVITVSRHARGDLVNRLGLGADKVRVTYEAADPQFLAPVSDADRRRVREAHGLSRPYLFYVGGWEQRKNIPFLVRGFAAAELDRVDLVLAGGRDDQRAALTELARSLGVADRLKLLGWVEDADLPALYAEALAFAYPSEYEGFGLQLCEAMALGCPTLAARATSLPEILGDGGDTFGLDSTDELAALLQKVAGDPSYRADLVARARRRVADFSWRRTAEQTVDVYREAIAASGRPVRVGSDRLMADG